MRTYEKKEIVIEQETGCVCDKCGRDIHTIDMSFEFQEKVSIEFTGGYGSVFGDGAEVSLDLCQHCFRDLCGEYIYIPNATSETEERS